MVLRTIAHHEPISAREVALDVGVPEHKARNALDRLQERGLISSHYNGHAAVRRVTPAGRETVTRMVRERFARVDQEALLTAADPASIVPCPACHGDKVYCATCVGCRFVTAEQLAEARA